MAKIKSIHADEILDTKSRPTIETTVVLSDGAMGKSSVPSGVIKATYESSLMRDTDNSRYGGMGVLQAVESVNTVIGPKLVGLDAFQQQKIDKTMIEMDGTQNKGKLGSNTMLSISQAVMKAAAKSSLLPLPLYIRQFVQDSQSHTFPVPMFNVIEGGKHSLSGIDMQEILIVPASAKPFNEALEIGTAVYNSLRTLLIERNLSTLVADVGGFSPTVPSNEGALNLVKAAIERTSYKYSQDVFLGLDAAANSFKNGKVYYLKDKTSAFDQDELVNFYSTLTSEFGLIYIEDPFAEDDWEGWKKMYSRLSQKAIIIGDDLTTTNPYRLQLALDNNVVSGVVIKPGQIGTITETIAFAEIARYKKLKLIVSSRSGDTMDDFIVDFAVGIGADYVKFGAPARERVFKYNRMLQIQGELKTI